MSKGQLVDEAGSAQDLPVELEEDGLVARVADAAWEKKALDMKVLDVRGLVSYADFFVICSGRSDRQVQAIAQNIADELRDGGVRPLGVEGIAHGHWVLMDYGDIIVHVFHISDREEYGLERIWGDAPSLDMNVPADLRTDRDAEGQYASV